MVKALEGLGILSEVRVASAHKTPRYLLDMLAKYEADPQPKVYITVAGRSNALSGLVDAQVTAPVIACPPYSERFAGGDVLSSLRVPSGVAPAVILEPESAALLAAKMLGLADPSLCSKIRQTQEEQRQRLLEADALHQQSRSQ
jgi:phosphoribosylaminoimidazole carboxylase PurE protein